jgi:outer membrane protein assembly factor BamA
MKTLLLFFIFCQICFAEVITGYEIVADQNLVNDIKQLRLSNNIGKEFSRKILLDDIRKIQDIGTVGMVRTEQKRYKNGIKLCYRVESNPRIKSIIIDGASLHIDIFNSHIGEILDYKKLYADINKISQLYMSKGIMYADVVDKKDVSLHGGDIRILVTEFRMGRLIIQGASSKLRTKFKIKSGDFIYRKLLLDSLCEALDLPGVKDIDWKPVFGTKTVDILLMVQEE